MGAARYDRIGHGYAGTRREDPLLQERIHAALGGARTVLNVGAGAGSYEPIDRVGFENVEFARFVKAHASYVRVRTLLELALEGSAPEAARSGVGVKTLKEWATGNGNASKPDMVRAANAAHGLRLLHLEHPKVVAGEATKAQAKREQDMADAIHVAFFVEQVARSAHL